MLPGKLFIGSINQGETALTWTSIDKEVRVKLGVAVAEGPKLVQE